MNSSSPPVEFAARTDVGRVRAHNEDAIRVRQDLGLAMLADGLGGYNAGEVASRRVVDFVEATMEPFIVEPPDYASLGELLVEAISVANRNVFRESEANAELRGMATTLVAGLFQQERVLLAYVGDSRCYRWRNEHLVQLSRDHTVYQSMLEQDLITPDNIHSLSNSGVLTRAIGVEPNVEVSYVEFETEPGDCYLFCSDGLTDMLADREIATALLTSGKDLESVARALIELANEWGGRDNVSVVLARYPEASREALVLGAVSID